MADKKEPSIPAWQIASNAPVPTEDDVNNSPGDGISPEKENPKLRESLTEAGQSKEEAAAALDPSIESARTQGTNLRTVHHSSSGRTPSSSADAQPSKDTTTSQSVTTAATSTSTSPPIITYPEYLYRSQKPPPLVTFDRLLYGLYGAAGLAAALYGTKEYILNPMLSKLTEARLDLSALALSNLQNLTERLAVQVPHAPLALQKPSNDFDKSDTDSLASDPTELFHRDTATQTTPSLPQSPTTAFPDPYDYDYDPTPQAMNPSTSQTASLDRLNFSLTSFKSQSDSAESFETSISDSLSGLKSYLDSLTYGGYESYYTHNSGSERKGGLAAAATKKQEDDELSRFRTETRSLKGALLSARNFPAGGNGKGIGYVR
ncbi:MAG: hypothetical protein Q9227_002605 [Pyrenula ochraceoflavens]